MCAHPREIVFGASGFLGLNLVDALAAAGVDPICVHRRRSNAIPLRRRGVTRIIAELDDVASLRSAVAGSDVVYHLAGHYPRDSVDGAAAIEQGCRQMANVLDAAAHEGVRRLVYVSSTATVAASGTGRPSHEGDVFPAAPDFGPYHELKWRMEQAALAEDRLEVTVACPSACLGPWDLKVGTAALLVATARGERPPHPDGLVNLVDVRDVARTLVQLGHAPDAPRRLLISGHTMQLQRFLERIAHRYGAAEPVAALSAAAAIALADAEERRVRGTVERARLVREIVDLVLHAVPLDTSRAEAFTGQPWTPLGETLDAFDAWARRMKIIPPPPAQATSQQVPRRASA